MSIQLGTAPEHGFDRPPGLLSDCHLRIERFLDQRIRVLGAQTAQPGATLSEEQRIALAIVLRYFREAPRMHTWDEEESLLPLAAKLLTEQEPKEMGGERGVRRGLMLPSAVPLNPVVERFSPLSPCNPPCRGVKRGT